jgi:hypothetical protein
MNGVGPMVMLTLCEIPTAPVLEHSITATLSCVVSVHSAVATLAPPHTSTVVLVPTEILGIVPLEPDAAHAAVAVPILADFQQSQFAAPPLMVVRVRAAPLMAFVGSIVSPGATPSVMSTLREIPTATFPAISAVHSITATLTFDTSLHVAVKIPGPLQVVDAPIEGTALVAPAASHVTTGAVIAASPFQHSQFSLLLGPFLMKRSTAAVLIELLSIHDVENWNVQPVEQPATMFSNDVHDAILEQYAFASSTVMPVAAGSSSIPVHPRVGIIVYSTTKLMLG